MTRGTTSTRGSWTAVCPIGEIVPETGVCALVGDEQVALFRTGADELYAIGNIDPFSGAAVLYRGIVGDRGDIPKVASPVFKQSFDLRTGRCLDDPDVSVPSYRVRLAGDTVEICTGP